MNKLRENANYTGAFIVENSKLSFQYIYPNSRGWEACGWSNAFPKEKQKKIQKSWEKSAVKGNISGISKLFVTAQQFPQLGGVWRSFKNPNAELLPYEFCFGFFNARRLDKQRETCFLRGMYLSIFGIFFVISI